MSDGPFCLSCFDQRISAATGYARLPDAPEPVELVGPDGRRHRLRYEISRTPGGISVELVEDGVPRDEGYRFRALGDHDADVAGLVNGARAAAQAGIATTHLDTGIDGRPALAGDEVVGRLEWDEQNPHGPYKVVIDGRSMSWEEFGNTLRAFEGWQFRLRIEGDLVDGLPAASSDPTNVVTFPKPHP